MSTNRINLIFRFLLEITALISVGIWGWYQANGFSQYLFALAIPLFVATLWGVFAVPDDPSRSGKAPIPTPRIIRLLLELVIFGFAIWALFDIGTTIKSLVMGTLVTIHYIVSYDRVLWLLKVKGK